MASPAEEKEAAAAAEYHSKDFEWEELRDEVESDPSLHYHLSPFSASNSSPSPGDAESWRSFHRRHSTGRFFKERRYLLKEFPDIIGSKGPTKVLEVGCGNGSTVLPILRAKQRIVVFACDCSPVVLERAKEMIATASVVSVKHRFHPFLLDFSVNGFPKWLFCATCRRSSMKNLIDLPPDVEDKDLPSLDERSFTSLSEQSFLKGDQCCVGGVDFVTMIFTLSAIPFQKMPFVIKECISVLKPGCLLLFRDYGVFDMTMLRFPPEQRVGFREYIRSDGTLSYFFSLDVVRDLFLAAGFIEMELEYCCVKLANHRSSKKMQRVWVHGKFQKPISDEHFC